MKRNILIILGIAIIAFIVFKNTKKEEDATASSTENTLENKAGIQFFHGNWEQALAKAKQENKLVFLDISASWCGPCKMLKANTFTDKSVGDFYNNSFVNVEVDGEVGEGITLAQKFQIEGYPSLIFVNGDGQMVNKVAGFMPAENFLAFGQSMIKK